MPKVCIRTKVSAALEQELDVFRKRRFPTTVHYPDLTTSLTKPFAATDQQVANLIKILTRLFPLDINPVIYQSPEPLLATSGRRCFAGIKFSSFISPFCASQLLSLNQVLAKLDLPTDRIDRPSIFLAETTGHHSVSWLSSGLQDLPMQNYATLFFTVHWQPDDTDELPFNWPILATIPIVKSFDAQLP